MLASAVEAIVDLLDLATRVISTPRAEQALSDNRGFARRVVLRLAFMDCRVSLFRLGGGGFVARLREIPCLSDIFEGEAGNGGLGLLRANLLRLRVADVDRVIHLQRQSEEVIGNSGNSTSASISTGTTGATMTFGQVAALRRDIERELRTYEPEEEDELCEAGTILDTMTYNRYIIAAALHSALLYLHRLVVSGSGRMYCTVVQHLYLYFTHSSPRNPLSCRHRHTSFYSTGTVNSPACSDILIASGTGYNVIRKLTVSPQPTPQWDPLRSITRILSLQLISSRDPSRSSTPSSIWPSSLLLAGVSTSDLIHRDWILEHFRRSERWGANIVKCRELLEEVIRRQRGDGGGGGGGGLVDIGDVMRETTGRFLL
jgi:hypothetical protein